MRKWLARFTIERGGGGGGDLDRKRQNGVFDNPNVSMILVLNPWASKYGKVGEILRKSLDNE